MYLFKNMTKIILKQAIHMFNAYISTHYITNWGRNNIIVNTALGINNQWTMNESFVKDAD